jgi:putative copper export protein
MKTTITRGIAFVSVLLNGLLAAFAFIVYVQGQSEHSRCEYCSLLLGPGILFLAFFCIALYTLFSRRPAARSRNKVLNYLNLAGVILAVAAVIFNSTA